MRFLPERSESKLEVVMLLAFEKSSRTLYSNERAVRVVSVII